LRLEGPVVLDASVVVEAVVRLTYPEQAREVFEAAASGANVELWAPDLVLPESASAIRSLVYRGDIDRSEADYAIESIAGMPLLVVGTRSLIEDAWKLIDSVTVYDACYAVLARQLRGTMITADAPLVRALQGKSVVHITDID
jgi:predicted nucleic acid-binding protein